MTLHPLLLAELARLGADETRPPADWPAFVRAMNATLSAPPVPPAGMGASPPGDASLLAGRAKILLQAIPDLIFLCKGDGRIVDYRAPSEDVLFVSPQAFLNKAFAEVLPGSVATPFMRAIGETLISGITRSIRYALPFPSGPRQFEARLSAAGPDECLILIRELTEQLRNEERLAAADRFSALATLAARVGNEIATPLTVVLANLGVVEEELQRRAMREPSNEARELLMALADAVEGVNRVSSIVRDLARAAQHEPEPEDLARVDVHGCLDDALQMAAGELRSRATVIRRYGVALPPVQAPEGRLVQVFVSLLVNAAQACAARPGGQQFVRITTGLDRAAVPPRIRVEVEDTGPGMDAATLARVFEPFFTTRGAEGHTGMGLAIAQGIVRSLGGELRVESEVGQGARATLSIPASVRDLQPAASSLDGFDFGAPLRSARILVVDDEPRILSAIRRVLAPHEVISVQSGAEADLRLSSRETFDLILIDLFMPDVTGMEVYARLKDRRPDLASRVIAMTGASHTSPAREFLERELLPVLEKPFDAGQVRSLVSRYLGE